MSTQDVKGMDQSKIKEPKKEEEEATTTTTTPITTGRKRKARPITPAKSKNEILTTQSTLSWLPQYIETQAEVNTNHRFESEGTRILWTSGSLRYNVLRGRGAQLRFPYPTDDGPGPVFALRFETKRKEHFISIDYVSGVEPQIKARAQLRAATHNRLGSLFVSESEWMEDILERGQQEDIMKWQILPSLRRNMFKAAQITVKLTYYQQHPHSLLAFIYRDPNIDIRIKQEEDDRPESVKYPTLLRCAEPSELVLDIDHHHHHQQDDDKKKIKIQIKEEPAAFDQQDDKTRVKIRVKEEPVDELQQYDLIRQVKIEDCIIKQCKVE